MYTSPSLNVKARSVNLSALGILVLTPLCDPVGTIGSIILDIKGDTVELECRVVRHSTGGHPGMALAFEVADAAVRARLRDYVNELRAKAG